MEEIKEIIKKIVKENTNDNYELTEEDFTADLKMMQLNSIQFIKIIVEIENKFDFEFEDDALDIQNYATLNDLVKFINKKMEENK